MKQILPPRILLPSPLLVAAFVFLAWLLILTSQLNSLEKKQEATYRYMEVNTEFNQEQMKFNQNVIEKLK